jgi:hypothetical protein
MVAGYGLRVAEAHPELALQCLRNSQLETRNWFRVAEAHPELAPLCTS